MAEEMTNAPVEGMEQNYLDTIQEMKRTMIGRDKYDALVAENAKLLDAVVNGQAIETAPQEQPKLRTPDEVYQDFVVSDKPRSNVERAKLWIEYRESCKAAGEPDPYVSNGTKIKPSAAELESVNRTQAALEHCIEYSGGNDAIFTNELNRILIDTNPFYS
jgi:hypothetical protein